MLKADLSGKKFGRLFVLHEGERRSKYLRRWVCVCDCGNKTSVITNCLLSGRTQSCGCFRRERICASLKTHGMSKTNEYRIWSGIIKRCENKNCRNWLRYGGRGIKICERWRNSFQAFYKDMGPRPSLAHSIDRINAGGNYEPSNCRWATYKEQARNLKTCLKVDFDSIAKSLGISYTAAYKRWKGGVLVCQG